MEILAENRFHLTKSLFFEGMARISKDTYGPWAKKFTLVLLLVWAAAAALLLCVGGSLVQGLIYLVPVSAICLWMNLLAPGRRAKKAWAALVNRGGENPERITRFYEDHLIIEASGAEKEFAYSDISEIKESKHLLVLMHGEKQGILLEKDGFSLGDCEKVLALIQGASYKECKL